MQFQRIVWLHSNTEINLSSQKNKWVFSSKEFLITAQSLLSFLLQNIMLYIKHVEKWTFLSLLEIYSALDYSSKKWTKMRKGCLKNTITYTIIILSRKIFKEISEVLCNRYMMSGNQILVKSASNINSHIIFSSSTKNHTWSR